MRSTITQPILCTLWDGVSRQQQHKHLQEYFEDILKFLMPQRL